MVGRQSLFALAPVGKRGTQFVPKLIVIRPSPNRLAKSFRCCFVVLVDVINYSKSFVDVASICSINI